MKLMLLSVSTSAPIKYIPVYGWVLKTVSSHKWRIDLHSLLLYCHFSDEPLMYILFNVFQTNYSCTTRSTLQPTHREAGVSFSTTKLQGQEGHQSLQSSCLFLSQQRLKTYPFMRDIFMIHKILGQIVSKNSIRSSNGISKGYAIDL